MKVAEARPSSNCESDLQAALASLTRNPQRFNVHTSHQVLKSRGARLTAVVADDLDRTNPDIEYAYIGVTSPPENRLFQHKEHMSAGFTSKYDVDRLLY